MTVVLAAGAAMYGLYWMQEQPCTRIDIRGLHMADSAEVYALTIPTGSAYQADIVADRVRRHPWIRSSTATCYPNGLLQVDVEERTPVMLVVDATGRSTYFVDPVGFMMPATGGHVFDVPLLRNYAGSYHPIQLVGHAGIRALAQALAQLDTDTERLFSEFAVTPEGITLHTVPTEEGRSVEVRLGREGYGSRFRRFRAFWDQRVRTSPDRVFEWIDLRFDGQIVTREAPIEHKKAEQHHG